ncbi:MAG: Txe/YoeB family addiction module toxin [Saprospiraceae bacterium]|nr:Txe/YoeB family addiction module toxin [Saprospiraceae bacterium]
MNFEFTSHAWEDFEYWMENDPEIIEKIKSLLRDIKITPFHGLGKPEPLKYDLQGFWSRGLLKHRLVYNLSGEKKRNQKCLIIQCRYHYDQ